MGIDNDNQKKKRSHNSDYYRIDDMCYEEGFLGEDVYNKAYLMFKDYRDAKFRNEFSVNNNVTPSQIEASKIFVRGTLMDVMSKPFTEAESEQRDLVKEVLSLAWFPEKLDYALIKVEEFPGTGKLYKKLLNVCYFKAESNKIEDFEAALFLGRSQFYARHREAVMLFGIILWKYAKRRELEDMDKGIIPRRPIYPDRPGDVRPERRKEQRDCEE